MSYKKEILNKIEGKSVQIGILGLGYVGLPLAVAFAKNNYKVIGIDPSNKKVEKVNSSDNYIGDVKDEELKYSVENNYLKATTNFEEIQNCDAIIICVPTPLDKFKKPDMSYIETSCKMIGKYMKKGVFISLESTTYPTTTEKFMLPIIEKESGYKVNEDFWLAYSPERVDPGNKNFNTENTPKVLGAISEDGLEIGEKLYTKAIPNIHTVSSPKVAEMVKILENTYRLINISLINELALFSGKIDIDIWEVIEAAKTKPYGFQAFYPGPGIGGHCIPLDPFYLEHIAKNYDFDLTMINKAGQVENMMSHRIMVKITTTLNSQKKSVNGSKILFIGVAYKNDIDDERESPALKIMDKVKHKGAEVFYHDKFISKIKTPRGNKFENININDKILQDMDCIILTTNHSYLDINNIIENSKLIVDLRNMTGDKYKEINKIFKL